MTASSLFCPWATWQLEKTAVPWKIKEQASSICHIYRRQTISLVGRHSPLFKGNLTYCLIAPLEQVMNQLQFTFKR